MPALIVLCTGACSNNIEYLSNDTLKEMGLNRDKAGKELTKGVFPKQLGGLAVGKKGDSYSEGRIVLIKRNGKDYLAETVLMDNSGKTNAAFDKSYLTLGSDDKNGGFRMELKFTF